MDKVSRTWKDSSSEMSTLASLSWDFGVSYDSEKCCHVCTSSAGKNDWKGKLMSPYSIASSIFSCSYSSSSGSFILHCLSTDLSVKGIHFRHNKKLASQTVCTPSSSSPSYTSKRTHKRQIRTEGFLMKKTKATGNSSQRNEGKHATRKQMNQWKREWICCVSRQGFFLSLTRESMLFTRKEGRKETIFFGNSHPDILSRNGMNHFV